MLEDSVCRKPTGGENWVVGGTGKLKHWVATWGKKVLCHNFWRSNWRTVSKAVSYHRGFDAACCILGSQIYLYQFNINAFKTEVHEGHWSPLTSSYLKVQVWLRINLEFLRSMGGKEGRSKWSTNEFSKISTESSREWNLSLVNKPPNTTIV